MHHSFLLPEPQSTVMRCCIPADASQHDEHRKHKMLRFNTANSCTGGCLAPLTRLLLCASSEWLESPPSPPQLSVHGRSHGCWALQHRRGAQGHECHKRNHFKAPSLQLQWALQVLPPKYLPWHEGNLLIFAWLRDFQTFLPEPWPTWKLLPRMEALEALVALLRWRSEEVPGRPPTAHSSGGPQKPASCCSVWYPFSLSCMAKA